MLEYMKHLLFIFLLVFCSVSFHGQISSFDMVKKMGRGINIGNVLSAPIEGNWAPVLFEQYFIDVKNAGFKNVRIPMDFYGDRTQGTTSVYSGEANTSASYNGSISDYIVDEDYLDRIEQVVNWSLNLGLVTIIDIHGAQLKSEFLNTFSSSNSAFTDPTSAKRTADIEKFKAIWLAIANRFKNYSEDLLFEVVNEPYFEMNATELDTLNTLIIDAIRSTGENNLTRNIIITGGGENSYQAPLQISDAVIAYDSYLIASFHYYQPFSFTSSSTETYNDFNWGSQSDKGIVDEHFEAVKSWSDSKNIPVTLGEFGADNENGLNYNTGVYGTFGGPINADRVEFHRYISEQAINRGFSFSVWDAGNKSTKSIHLRTDNSSTNNSIAGTWVEDVRNALLSSGTWPLCYGSSENIIIINPGFECGLSEAWSFNVSNTASAQYEDALSEARNGLSGARIEVINAEDYNRVLLRNVNYTQDISGKKVRIQVFAKSLATTGQSFKIRVKAVIDGDDFFIPSEAFILSNQYPSEPFEFQYTIEQNTSSIQVQVMLGKFEGIYFLDDFDAIIEDADILSKGNQIELKNQIEIYPNPSKNYLYIKNKTTNQLFGYLYNIQGRVLLNETDITSLPINLSKFENGTYFFVLKNKNGHVLKTKKIIKWD